MMYQVKRPEKLTVVPCPSRVVEVDLIHCNLIKVTLFRFFHFKE